VFIVHVIVTTLETNVVLGLEADHAEFAPLTHVSSVLVAAMVTAAPAARIEIAPTDRTASFRLVLLSIPNLSFACRAAGG
jgi:hypothetical protein